MSAEEALTSKNPPLWPAVSVKSCYVARCSSHWHRSLTSTGGLYKKKNPTWSVGRREDGRGWGGNELCITCVSERQRAGKDRTVIKEKKGEGGQSQTEAFSECSRTVGRMLYFETPITSQSAAKRTEPYCCRVLFLHLGNTTDGSGCLGVTWRLAAPRYCGIF